MEELKLAYPHFQLCWSLGYNKVSLNLGAQLQQKHCALLHAVWMPIQCNAASAVLVRSANVALSYIYTAKAITDITKWDRGVKYRRNVYNRPNSQIPQCTCPTSHNAPFRTEMCTFLFWMVHCGIWYRCIVGFVRLVYRHDVTVT